MNRRILQPVLAVLLGLVAVGAEAQAPTGRIVGRIIDRATGQGLSDVGVQVVGTRLGAMSGLDGRYAIANVPAGTVTLHVRRIGYQPKTITGLQLAANDAIEQDITLDAANVELAAVEVTATAERGTVNAALDRQRTATQIVSEVTAEQIARSPDGDAAAAIQRVSGVTVQDGKYVFVRGLGERYTTTSLNGARMPSPDPERKVVPLDLFPAGLLQTVTTSKTFTPDQSGDFSGAQVDIRTREFPAQRQLSYAMSLGWNSRATGKSIIGAPTVGLEWLGFGGAERHMPRIVGSYGNFDGSLTAPEYANVVRSFRNAWSVREREGAPNSSFSVSVGGNDPVLGRRVGYLASLTYSAAAEQRAEQRRAFAIPSGTGAGVLETERYDGSTGSRSVLWGGMLNLSSLFGSSSRIALNNTYTRSADNEARDESGIDEDDMVPLRIQRLRYVERSVWSSQLTGEHQPGARHRLEWQLAASGVRRDEPDRSEIVYAMREDVPLPFLYNNPESAVRSFMELEERSYGAGADYALSFGRAGRESVVSVGALARSTERDALNNMYDIGSTLGLDARQLAPEEIFDGRFTAAGSDAFRVRQIADGGSYDASDRLLAAYGMVEWQFADRLRLVAGARVERSEVEVVAQSPFDATPVAARPRYTDVLPSAALNVRLGETQNLRVSASQTLARPEYREIASVDYRDVAGGEIVRGNPALARTLIQNADIRWEWYPQAGEVLSAALFAKRFDRPIERVYQGTSGTRVTTFENAESAVNYGVEIEARKGLGFIAPSLSALSAFTNVTVMRSEIDLSNVAAGSYDENRPMVGQAPHVVNAGLTYASGSGSTSATLLYNVVGRRIHSASLAPLPNVYEEARDVLDLSVRFPLRGALSARLDAKNLFDAPYEVTQGSVVREYHRVGRTVAFGLAWRP